MKIYVASIHLSLPCTRKLEYLNVANILLVLLSFFHAY
jgi:hypothetical protein